PLDHVFMALADKSRRQLVHRLALSELTMTELAQGFEMSLAAISKHVKVLEAAKLVKRRKAGRVHHISLVPEQLTEALDWISIYRHFWQKRMDSLTEYIENNEE
ncbi:MAG: metalloregulator ArsR/SmtB family transcription factor, partial [Psychrosphaera sp.]|nr:metalloregulator ArsR/SmtB family transcription factor [Psychrosphaera sp.]